MHRNTGRQASRPKAGPHGAPQQPGPRPAAKGHNSSRSRIVYDATRPRYKQWRGRHRFYLGGRIMMGPNVKQFFLTLGLTVLTWSSFFVFAYPSLPRFFPSVFAASGPNWPALALCAFELLGMTLYLVITATSDPGIIPRSSPSHLVDSMPLEMKERMNYCPTCHIVKPARTKHCRQTDCCIRRFDHHCPWTGNR